MPSEKRDALPQSPNLGAHLVKNSMTNSIPPSTSVLSVGYDVPRESAKQLLLNEEGSRVFNELVQMHGHEKAVLGMNALLIVSNEIKKDVARFASPEGITRLAKCHVLIEDESLWVTVCNYRLFGLHYLSSYFEAQDRPQIASRLRLDDLANRDEDCIKFEDNLGRLFCMRDFLRGAKTVGPITKQMINDNIYPQVRYISTIFPENQLIAADRARQERMIEIIDYLASRFNPHRRHYWRTVFKHIADGGDGSAAQKRGGERISDNDRKVTREAWEVARLQGKTMEQFADGMGWSLSAVKRRLNH